MCSNQNEVLATLLGDLSDLQTYSNSGHESILVDTVIQSLNRARRDRRATIDTSSGGGGGGAANGPVAGPGTLASSLSMLQLGSGRRRRMTVTTVSGARILARSRARSRGRRGNTAAVTRILPTVASLIRRAAGVNTLRQASASVSTDVTMDAEDLMLRQALWLR